MKTIVETETSIKRVECTVMFMSTRFVTMFNPPPYSSQLVAPMYKIIITIHLISKGMH